MKYRSLFSLFIGAATVAMLAASVSAEHEVDTIVSGLTNPSGVSFGQNGQMAVGDARGKVVVVRDGKSSDYLVDFATEHWKKDDDGNKWYKVGPLSTLWLGDTLVVADSGREDGLESIKFFNNSGSAVDGSGTNSIGPTNEKDEKDKGEGNLTGMCLSNGRDKIYVCGQGYDSKTWVLGVDIATMKLETLFSADDNGIETNSPMQAVMKSDGKLLVLYSGKGGAADGLVVEWDVIEKKPTKQWKLPGLVNPMGMAKISDDRFAIVENNWDLKSVKDGRVAIVTLGEGDAAEVEPLEGVSLKGPVSCAFGPDGRLYVSQLGEKFDGEEGSVVAISGVK